MNDRGVQLIHSSSYHPQRNSVDRTSRDKPLWRQLCMSSHRDWYKHLTDIVLLLNNSISETIQATPAQIHLNVQNSNPMQTLFNVPGHDSNFET